VHLKLIIDTILLSTEEYFLSNETAFRASESRRHVKKGGHLVHEVHGKEADGCHQWAEQHHRILAGNALQTIGLLEGN
jgi:hypothetical protein